MPIFEILKGADNLIKFDDAQDASDDSAITTGTFEVKIYDPADLVTPLDTVTLTHGSGGDWSGTLESATTTTFTDRQKLTIILEATSGALVTKEVHDGLVVLN